MNIIKTIYLNIYGQIKSGKTKIRIINSYGLSLKRINEIIIDIISHNPQFWYIDLSCIRSTYCTESVVIELSNIMPDNELQCAKKSINRRLDSIISSVIADSCITEIEKIERLYRFFQNNISYDYKVENKHTFTAYGALVEGKAVCQGISQAFCLLLKIIGIECVQVFGESKLNTKGSFSNHSWCIAKLYNHYVHIDPTWDICLYQDGHYSYDYFCIDDSISMISHKWNVYNYPKCDCDEYDYYVRSKSLLSTEEQLRSFFEEKLFYKQIRFGARVSESLVGMLENSEDLLDLLNNAAERNAISISYSYSININAYSFTFFCTYM